MKPTELQFDDRAAWGEYQLGGVPAMLLKLCHALPAALPGGRRLAMWLRHPLKHRLDQPVDAQVWGLKMRLMPRGNLSESRLLFTPQFLDKVEFSFLKDHLTPSGTFLDIGANAGVYSFWAARCMGTTGRVLAIEPDPEMRRRLAFNQATNGIESMTVAPVALSDRSGAGQLIAGEGNRGQNTLLDPDESLHDQAIAVSTMTLPALCQANGIEQIDALKIDIEGHETRVMRHFFEHAPRTLWPKAMIFESCTDQQATSMRDLALEQGYRIQIESKMNMVAVR